MTHSIKNNDPLSPEMKALAQKIDHTLLKPTLSVADLTTLCAEAAQYQFKTVCIPQTFVTQAVQLLKGTSVDVITVVGFPLGYSYTESKVLEAKQAIHAGAKEIDMVANIAFIKNSRWNDVETDIRDVVKACGSIPLKVIIETAYLTTEEKIKVALVCEKAGATFVKTSTGFATPPAGISNGATLADIELLRQTLKPTTKIKASGGIRDFESAMQMIQAGADRLGTSAGVAIVNGLKNEGGY
jgi:deoxyribose-phosphate aldolase